MTQEAFDCRPSLISKEKRRKRNEVKKKKIEYENLLAQLYFKKKKKNQLINIQERVALVTVF